MSTSLQQISTRLTGTIRLKTAVASLYDRMLIARTSGGNLFMNRHNFLDRLQAGGFYVNKKTYYRYCGLLQDAGLLDVQEDGSMVVKEPHDA